MNYQKIYYQIIERAKRENRVYGSIYKKGEIIKKLPQLA